MSDEFFWGWMTCVGVLFVIELVAIAYRRTARYREHHRVPHRKLRATARRQPATGVHAPSHVPVAGPEIALGSAVPISVEPPAPELPPGAGHDGDPGGSAPCESLPAPGPSTVRHPGAGLVPLPAVAPSAQLDPALTTDGGQGHKPQAATPLADSSRGSLGHKHRPVSLPPTSAPTGPTTSQATAERRSAA